MNTSKSIFRVRVHTAIILSAMCVLNLIATPLAAAMAPCLVNQPAGTDYPAVLDVNYGVQAPSLSIPHDNEVHRQSIIVCELLIGSDPADASFIFLDAEPSLPGQYELFVDSEPNTRADFQIYSSVEFPMNDVLPHVVDPDHAQIALENDFAVFLVSGIVCGAAETRFVKGFAVSGWDNAVQHTMFIPAASAVYDEIYYTLNFDVSDPCFGHDANEIDCSNDPDGLCFCNEAVVD